MEGPCAYGRYLAAVWERLTMYLLCGIWMSCSANVQVMSVEEGPQRLWECLYGDPDLTNIPMLSEGLSPCSPRG